MNSEKNVYPNPWDFGNENSELVSPDGLHRIGYSILGEIAMGAPLGGECFWVNESGQRMELKGWFAGPPIWDKQGKLVAIPTWDRSIFGTLQRIAILDIEKAELVLYKRRFRVLQFKHFDQNIITGIDSPIYKTKSIHFDLGKERIKSRKKVIG